MKTGRKRKAEPADSALRAAEHLWFDLKRWCCDRPPFVAGMSAAEREELRELCGEFAAALAKARGAGA